MIKEYWCPFCKEKLRKNQEHSSYDTYFCKCNDKTNYDGCYSWEHHDAYWEYWQLKNGWVRCDPKTTNGFVFR